MNSQFKRKHDGDIPNFSERFLQKIVKPVKQIFKQEIAQNMHAKETHKNDSIDKQISMGFQY